MATDLFDDPYVDEEPDVAQEPASDLFNDPYVDEEPATDLFDDPYVDSPEVTTAPAGVAPAPVDAVGGPLVAADEDEGNFVRRTKGAYQGLQATAYGAAGIVGQAIDSDKLRDWGFEGYTRNIKEAEGYRREGDVENFTDIDWSDHDSISNWLVGSAGELIPSIVESMVMAGAGAVIGGATGAGAGALPGAIVGLGGKAGIKKVLRNRVAAFMKSKIGKDIYKKQGRAAARLAANKAVGGAIGGAMGVIVGTAIPEGGGMWGEDATLHGVENANWLSAAGLGTVSGISEVVAPGGRFARKLFSKGGAEFLENFGKTAGKNLFKRLGIQIPKAVAGEFAQESFQEFLGQINSKITDITGEVNLMDKEALVGYFNAGMKGAVGGGFFGTAGALTTPGPMSRSTGEETLANPAKLKGPISAEHVAMVISQIDDNAGDPNQSKEEADNEFAVVQNALQTLLNHNELSPEAKLLLNENQDLLNLYEVEKKGDIEEALDAALPPEPEPTQPVTPQERATVAVEELPEFEGVDTKALHTSVMEKMKKGKAPTDPAELAYFKAYSEVVTEEQKAAQELQKKVDAVAEYEGFAEEEKPKAATTTGAKDDRIGDKSSKTGAAGEVASGTTKTITVKGSLAQGQQVETEPSEDQKKAGNYLKPHKNIDGMAFTLENPAGTTRSGTDAKGKKWSQKMAHDYGYIKGTVGFDKDQIDVFFNKGYEGGAETVHVVNQHNEDGSFDEHKVVIGAKSIEDARKIYESNYEKGWTGGRSVIAMPMKEFKTWVKSPGPKKGELKEPATTEAFQKEATKVVGKVKTMGVMALITARANRLGLTSDEYIKHRGISLVTGEGQEVAGKKVTDEMRQANKGVVDFSQEGQAIIHAFDNADISTIVHELGHIFRRELNPGEMKVAERWVGAEPGATWTMEQEEKFARGWEQYIASGKAEGRGIRQLFDKFSRWMMAVYQSLQHPDIDVTITQEVKALFDGMLSDGVAPKVLAQSDIQGLATSILPGLKYQGREGFGLYHFMPEEGPTTGRSFALMEDPTREGIIAAMNRINDAFDNVDVLAQKSWRNWEPELDKNGKPKGSPEWVVDRKTHLKMRANVRKFLSEGLKGRYWYENSAKAVMKVVKGDVVEAEKLIQLIAIYSPLASVRVNTGFAIKAWNIYKNGGTLEDLKSVKYDHQGEKAADVLFNDKPFDGRKTNSFYINLVSDIIKNDPTALEKMNLDNETLAKLDVIATIDLWMYRAFGYIKESGGDDKKSGKYTFSEGEVRKLTDQLNHKLPAGKEKWAAYQVQAAIWTAMKARYEDPVVKLAANRESVRKGFSIAVKSKGKKTTYERKPDIDSKEGHLQVWRKHAMKITSAQTTANADEWAADFSTFFDMHTSVITWEAQPSPTFNLDLLSASDHVQEMFIEEATQIIVDEDGRDTLAEMLGVPLAYIKRSSGAYEGDVGSNNLTHLIPTKDPGAFTRDHARAYAKAIQYIFKQNAVPWFRADSQTLNSKIAQEKQMFKIINTKTGKMVNGSRRDLLSEAQEIVKKKGEGFEVRGGPFARGVTITFNEKLNRQKERDVLSSLIGFLGEDTGFTKTDGNELTIINYRDDETGVPYTDDIVFLQEVTNFIDANSADIKESGHMFAEGEYGHVQNWERDIQIGEHFTGTTFSESSDLQSWVRNRRAAFESILANYTGEELQKREKEVGKNTDVLAQTQKKLNLTHYSAVQGLLVLDPSYGGTGISGEEATRKKNDPTNWLNRIYYALVEGTYKKEPGLGPHKYDVSVPASEVYDIVRDPEGFLPLAKAAKVEDPFVETMSVLEKMIRDNGYIGYKSQVMGGTAAIFEPVQTLFQSTPEFKQWFGDSKVVDDSGNPKTVYHGSPTFGKDGKHIFRKGEMTKTTSPMRGLGHFFAETRQEAQGYAGPAGTVNEVFLSIENPLVITSDKLPQFKDVAEARAFTKRKQLIDHDGIYISDEGHWIAFEPNQIKSTENLIPTQDPDILFQEKGVAPDASAEHGADLIIEIMRKLKAAATPAAKKKFDADEVVKIMEWYIDAQRIIKDPRQSVAEKQDFLAKFAFKMPLTPRGKFLKPLQMVAKLKTSKGQNKQMTKFLARADKELSAYLKTEFIKKIKKNVKPLKRRKGVQRGRGYKYEQDMAYIRDHVLGFDRDKVEREIASQEARIEQANEVLISPNSSAFRKQKAQEKIEDAESRITMAQLFGNMKEKTFDETIGAYHALNETISEGRATWRAANEARKAHLAMNQAKAARDITGEDDPTPENLSERNRRERKMRKLWPKFKETLSSAENLIQSWELMLDKISSKSGAGIMKSWLVTHFSSVYQYATRNNKQMDLDTNAAIQEKAKEIFGKKTNLAMNRKFAKLDDKPSEDKIFIYPNGKKTSLPMTEMEAAYLYLIGKGYGKENKNIDDTFDSMGITEETLDQIENFLSPEVKAWADWIQTDFLENYHDGINQVHRIVEGINLTKSKDYIPLHREVVGKVEDKKKEAAVSGRGLGSMKKGGLHQRVYNTNHFKIMNLNDVLVKHTKDMNHYKAWAVASQEINGVFNSPEIQRFIEQHYGNSSAAVIRNFQEAFVATPGQDVTKDEMKGLAQWRGRVATFMVGMNPVVFMKQLTSIPAFAADIPVVTWTKYTTAALLNPVKAWNTVKSSPMLTDRWKAGHERDVAAASRLSGSKLISGVSSMPAKMMVLTKLGDSAAIVIGGYAVYKHHYNQAIKAGKGVKEADTLAMVQFEASFLRSQQSAGVGDLGWFLRGGQMQRMFTLFLTAPAAYSRQLFTAVRHLKDDPINATKRLIIYGVILPAVFQTVADAFLIASDDDDDRDRALNHLLKALGMGVFNGIPGVRTIANIAIENLIGGESFMRDQTWSPMTELIKQPGKALYYGGKYIREGDDEMFNKAVENLIYSGGILTGIPTKNFKKIWDGVDTAYEGKTDHPWARLLGYSDYALNERKK